MAKYSVSTSTGPELAQAPWLVFGFGEDGRAGGAPAVIEFVDLLSAGEVEPDDDAAVVRNMRHSPWEIPPMPPFSMLLTGISGTALGKCADGAEALQRKSHFRPGAGETTAMPGRFLARARLGN